jgi:hypothetical protein
LIGIVVCELWVLGHDVGIGVVCDQDEFALRERLEDFG